MWMPLQTIEAFHVRVTCVACRATAEVCGKRELEALVRATAVPKFERAGWNQDIGEYTRTSAMDMARRDGTGKWYCPQCARNKHL